VTALARLVFPALRWRNGSFAHERARIDAALAAGVGGFILFGGTSEAVAALTLVLRDIAGRPLLIGADLERGAAQQVRGLTELPPPAALGVLDDLEATAAAGVLTAREAAAVGINWVFAPVCDLDVEPANPIVQTRSFGADPARVAAHAEAWIRACQEHGVLACAKHYPGHGRTTLDSHEGLPDVTASRETLERADLAPFGAALSAGVGSVMAAFVSYSAWDPSGRAAGFSPEILGWLGARRFAGVTVTDALIMGGALAVTLPLFPWIQKRQKSLLGEPIQLPVASCIDARLIIGAAIFGVGWGLAGLCPGPALANLASLSPSIVLFVAAMIAGQWLAIGLNAR